MKEEEEDEEEEDAYLPIPNQSLSRLKQVCEEEDVEEKARNRREWEMERERELEDGRLREIKWENRNYEDSGEDHEQIEWGERESSQSLNNLLSLESRETSPLQREPFFFLTTSSELENAECGASHSDGSIPAACVSGLSLALTEGAVLGAPCLLLPGSWITPSQQRTGFIQENWVIGKQRERGRGRGVIE